MPYPTVGVLAIVDGMDRFRKDTDDIKQRLTALEQGARQTAAGTGVLSAATGGLGSALGQVLTIASGILAADVFRSIARGIGEMAGSAFEAAADLQKLELQFQTLAARELFATNTTQGFADWMRESGGATEYQVQRFINLRAAHDGFIQKMDQVNRTTVEGQYAYDQYSKRLAYIDDQIAKVIPNFDNLSGMMQEMAYGTYSFGEALRDASGPADALLGWAIAMSVTTPFTPKTISEAISLSMAMGFTSAQTKRLTTAVGNFTAGMGLTDDVMVRILYNFGQMRNAGKVTGTELRDLARGAFFPVNSVLNLMQQNLGMTGMSFDAFKKQAGAGAFGVDAFFEAFMQMAESDFQGAMERMSTTWKGVTQDFGDFVDVVLGARIIQPVLDALSGGLRGVIDMMTDPSTIEKLQTTENFMRLIVQRVGELAGLLGFDFDFDAAGMFDDINWALRNLFINLTDIKTFLEGGMDLQSLLDRLLPGEGLPEGVQRIFDDLLPAIGRVFEEIGPIVERWAPIFATQFGLMSDALGKGAGEGGGTILDGLVSAIDSFGQWISDNEGLIDAAMVNVSLFLAWITNDVIPALSTTGAETAANFLTNLGSAIASFIELMLAIVANDKPAAGQAVVDLIKTIVSGIAEAIFGIAQTIVEAFTGQPINWDEVLLVWLDLSRMSSIITQHIVDAMIGSPVDWNAVWTAFFDTDTPMINAVGEIGKAIIDGIIDGMKARFQARLAEVTAIVETILALMRKALGMNSPSREMMVVGRNIMAGLEKGMHAGERGVEGQVAAAAGGMVAAPQAAMAGGGGTYNRSVSINNVYNQGLTARVFDQNMRAWLGG